jgi:DNA-directed RNA polymerase specialized sigma24 family protein
MPERDREGFVAFVTARGASLRGYACLLTHDSALADDLVQTALAEHG